MHAPGCIRFKGRDVQLRAREVEGRYYMVISGVPMHQSALNFACTQHCASCDSETSFCKKEEGTQSVKRDYSRTGASISQRHRRLLHELVYYAILLVSLLLLITSTGVRRQSAVLPTKTTPTKLTICTKEQDIYVLKKDKGETK